MRDDDTSTPAGTRPGASLLGAAVAMCGAVAMAASARSLHELAQTSHGSETLVIWVLLALAGLGASLCLYLALVWGLAVAILLAGPASRTGTALLGALRVLAPRMARRLASGAAIATATTALTLAPGMASEHHFGADPDAADSSSTQAAEQLWAEVPPADPTPEAAAPASSDRGTGSSSTGAPLPPLGWGGSPAPSTTDDPVPLPADTGTADRRGDDAGTSVPAPAPSRTVVVHPGDSLWSISDDLLGPGASDPAQIAAAWPLLHETNRDVIGEDPDQLRPGQQLTVPADLTTQDMS